MEGWGGGAPHWILRPSTDGLVFIHLSFFLSVTSAILSCFQRVKYATCVLQMARFWKQIQRKNIAWEHIHTYVHTSNIKPRSRTSLKSDACSLVKIPTSKVARRDADKSLARPTSRCRRTESIVSLERGVCSCAELQVFSCYRDWKEACQAMRAI